MTQATVTEIREAMASQLGSAIAELNAFPRWPETVAVPMAVPMPDIGHYHDAMGSPGYQSMKFQVQVIAAPVQRGYGVGQEALDPYIAVQGPQSIKAGLEGDSTLGGIVDTLRVGRWHDYGVIDVEGLEWWSVKVEVEVWP
jgi:hypothetical protein